MPEIQTLLKYDFEQLASSKFKLPEGYVFVPKGDVYITRRCRTLTGENGNTLYVVYDERTKKRLGLQCPREIYKNVLRDSESSALSRSENVLAKDRRDLAKAGVTLLKLFPRIPPKDAEAVLAHAFLKGSKRVGRKTTLSEHQKFRFAVTAHIRHTKTPYEALLRQKKDSAPQKSNTSFRDGVRRRVQAQVNEVLRSWGPQTAAPLVRDESVVARDRRASVRSRSLSEADTNSSRNSVHQKPDGGKIRRDIQEVSVHTTKRTETRTRSSDALKILSRSETQIVGRASNIRKRAIKFGSMEVTSFQRRRKRYVPTKGPKSRSKPLLVKHERAKS